MDKNLGGMANVWDSTTPNQLQPARQSASNRLEPVVRTAAQAQTVSQDTYWWHTVSVFTAFSPNRIGEYDTYCRTTVVFTVVSK